MAGERPGTDRLARAALLAAVVSVTLQCIGPIFVRKAGFSGLVFAFHRMWIAAFVYLAVSKACGAWPSWHAIRVSAPGGIWFAFNVATFFVAVHHTTIANAMVISALQPVTLMLLSSRLFGEHVRRADLALTAFAIAGVAVVVFARGTAGSGDRFGDALAFCSMLGYAAYYVSSKKARTTLGTLEYQTSLTLVAVAVLGIVMVASRQDLSAPRTSSWGWALAMVALPGSGHLLTNFAHAHVRLGVLGVLTLFSPVGSVFLAWLLLDEGLNGWQLIGMAVVIGSLTLIVAASTRRSPQLEGSTPDLEQSTTEDVAD